MADVKLSGQEDLAKLMRKKDTWKPPELMNEYLDLLRQVVATSRYKDMYRELRPEDLHAIVRVKAYQCFWEGQLDLEEVVDVGAYAALLFLRAKEKSGTRFNLGLRKVPNGELLVSAGDPNALKQVNAPEPEPEPEPAPKTENTNCLKGFRCPKCGCLGPFTISVSCFAEVHDDGITDTWEHEWHDDSPCSCKCGMTGKVSEFDLHWKPVPKSKKSKKPKSKKKRKGK